MASLGDVVTPRARRNMLSNFLTSVSMYSKLNSIRSSARSTEGCSRRYRSQRSPSECPQLRWNWPCSRATMSWVSFQPGLLLSQDPIASRHMWNDLHPQLVRQLVVNEDVRRLSLGDAPAIGIGLVNRQFFVLEIRPRKERGDRPPLYAPPCRATTGSTGGASTRPSTGSSQARPSPARRPTRGRSGGRGAAHRREEG